MASGQNPLYSSSAFRIYPNKVVQGNFTAQVISNKEMRSNYKSPVNLYPSANLVFKFSINGRDNELIPGVEHHYTVTTTNGKAETPVIRFGHPLTQPTVKGKVLQPNTPVTFRVDCRELLKSINEKGYYQTINGDKIYKQDFKGIFIAGPSAPMTWDFDNLVNHPDLKLNDTDGDGIYEVTLIMNKKEDEKITDSVWRLTRDISAFPQYQSPFPISDAIYNMSLEEMINAVEPDSTFRTGKEWGGVWTRDISYSIILSMAQLQPMVAKYSLLRKVNSKKRIIQDTGTGGSWPVSTDRMIWAVAAWQLFISTGDTDWLNEAYEIIKNSTDDDLQVIYDPVTGLVKGESSFLDWRDQTYPKWMQPADIYESECLGTNAVHYQSNRVLSLMANQLGRSEEAARYGSIAERIKKGINDYLWIPELGYYGQYLYGRNYKIVSPKSEALGEALCVIFGIADKERASQVVQHTPVTPYGITCIYPQIPNIPPYHNNAIWPFVQSYWLWAAASTGNEKSVMASISDIYRPAALFLTNKENFVAGNGDFNGTQVNSSNMLWSLSGNISLVMNVLFGIHPEVDHIRFSPFIPKALNGTRYLRNFKFRNAEYDIELRGFGNQITSFTLDGKIQQPIVSASLIGKHQIVIALSNHSDNQPIHRVENKFSIQYPHPSIKNNKLNWEPVKGAAFYKVFKNGKHFETNTELSIPLSDKEYSEYMVVAYSGENDKTGSFASEPVANATSLQLHEIQIESFINRAPYHYQGSTGNGFIETSKEVNPSFDFPIQIFHPGVYAFSFRYSNGNGPSNTDNKCAIRTLYADNNKVGTVVFPQRGKDEWSNWGNTNTVQVRLDKGNHTISVRLEPYDENMNGTVNQAMIDRLDFVRIGD